jgi:hypothetical protein
MFVLGLRIKLLQKRDRARPMTLNSHNLGPFSLGLVDGCSLIGESQTSQQGDAHINEGLFKIAILQRGVGRRPVPPGPPLAIFALLIPSAALRVSLLRSLNAPLVSFIGRDFRVTEDQQLPPKCWINPWWITCWRVNSRLRR